MKAKFVYFVKSGHFVKIGTSKNFISRLSELQVGNPEKLKILGRIFGDRTTEKKLHKRFAKHHHRGEWFRLEGDLLKAMDCANLWTIPIDLPMPAHPARWNRKAKKQ